MLELNLIYNMLNFLGIIKLAQINHSLTTLSLDSITVPSSKLLKRLFEECTKNSFMPLENLIVINVNLDKNINVCRFLKKKKKNLNFIFKIYK